MSHARLTDRQACDTGDSEPDADRSVPASRRRACNILHAALIGAEYAQVIACETLCDLFGVPEAEWSEATEAMRNLLSPAEDADQASAQLESAEVLGLAFVAAVQTAAVAQPGHRALDRPPVPAEPGGGLDAFAGDAVPDASLA